MKRKRLDRRPSVPDRKPAREKLLAWLLLLAVLALNAAGLWPELSISRVDMNDNVSHFTMLDRMVQAVERGEDPLDFWSSEVTFGYPVFRTYQPLAHGMVALVYFALGKTISLMTIFTWVRFLSVLLVPLSFFAAARLMGLPPLTAAAAAVVAPLPSTYNGSLFGLEYRSYVWSGFGMFSQSVAVHFLLLTLGFGWRAIRRGRHLAVTGALLGLTCLAHLIYGWMGAVTLCLLALMPDSEVARWVRIRRTVWVGTVALLLTVFQLLPLLLDGSFINHSRFEPAVKWDSYGAGQVLKWLFTGQLLDYGRVPVLSLLALFGAAGLLWRFRRSRRMAPVDTFVLLGAAFWLLVFFGRPAWGPLLLLLGVSPDMHLHRVIGALHVFLILLAAIGLAAVWREAARRWHVAVAVIVTALLLAPMVVERARLLADNATKGRQNLMAVALEQNAIDAVIANVKEHGGRAYAGLASTWGAAFKAGGVPFYGFLSMSHVPAVSFMYNNLALTTDIMMRFDEVKPAHFRLFNIRSVVAPAMPGAPAFLSARTQMGRFRIYDAPGTGYFEIVDVAASVPITRSSFYDVNDRWLHSDWVEKRQHLWLYFRGDAPAGMPRLSSGGALPQVSPISASPGEIKSERQDGEVYQAEFEAARPSFVLFRMTWHPNWRAYIDGRPEKTAMLSPGFLGVPVTAGRHHILCRYEPGKWRTTLAIAGFLIVILIIAAGR